MQFIPSLSFPPLRESLVSLLELAMCVLPPQPAQTELGCLLLSVLSTWSMHSRGEKAWLPRPTVIGLSPLAQCGVGALVQNLFSGLKSVYLHCGEPLILHLRIRCDHFPCNVLIFMVCPQSPVEQETRQFYFRIICEVLVVYFRACPLHPPGIFWVEAGDRRASPAAQNGW